ncbi:SMI1/KNR4 family protein [Nocardiopsis exhalans]|uniref:SMI1/KNR4 family protein n=1 Tax=Nocardiopsis exhalans TaxID=163604 RepID=A0ABY5DHU3_9ACTN|nr:SMI1/KNR4 family protein [Nocardiopsis exhalans]USY22782.1 SMI1/KNR4 family protein [Nocardiopsis exhalans]
MASDDDVVFEAVRERVFSGEYLDHRLSLPEIASGGATQCWTGREEWQTVYLRGTPEYDTALAAGQLEPLPPLTPASEEAVHECEKLLGRPLPPLLRRCYLELGDGGFGPGYGLFSLRDSEHGDSVVDAIKRQVEWPRAWQPMAGSLMPLCAWGCGIESLIDCRNSSGGMWAIDPNPAPEDDPDVMLFPETFTFTEWMRRWIDGTLQQPWLLQDEEKGFWRGATDAECGAR